MKVDVQKLIEVMDLSESSLADISVHSMFTDDDEEDNSIVNHLYRNLMDNSIKLPSLPSVAERIQRIYRGKATDIDAMVHILISYPDIARKINNVARCASNDKLNATGKIRYSINKLGMRALYCLIMTYAVGKLVKRMPHAHLQRVGSFWHHSLNVAALSRILAKKTRTFSPDEAMLAGLIHGIGVLVIDDQLLEHHQLLLDHLEIDHAIQVMRPEISSLLLRKWDFANELILVAEECGDWSRNPDGPADLCDLVLVANYYGMMQGDVNHSLPKINSIPAMEKLGITPQGSIDAIKEATVVRRNIKKLFS
jgi:HD-like signal output (HDOD) protein